MSNNLEIVHERDLSQLKICNTAQAWALIKRDIEDLLGKHLVCVPSLSERSRYNINSLFVKIHQQGIRGKRYRTYKPLGYLNDVIDKEKSLASWHDTSDKISTSDVPGKLQSLRVTVKDPIKNKKICVVSNNLSRATFLKEYNPIGKVRLMKTAVPGFHTVYIVNNVVLTGNLDFYVDVGDDSEAFHSSEQWPLVFSYQKYKLGEDAQIIGKKPTTVTSYRAKWTEGGEKSDELVDLMTSVNVIKDLQSKDVVKSLESKDVKKSPESKDVITSPESKDVIKVLEPKAVKKSTESKDMIKSLEPKAVIRSLEPKDVIKSPEPKDVIKGLESKDAIKGLEPKDVKKSPESKDVVKSVEPKDVKKSLDPTTLINPRAATVVATAYAQSSAGIGINEDRGVEGADDYVEDLSSG